MKTAPVRSRSAGFTLLELVLAMALLAIIIGMVFATARSSLSLGNTIVKTQNEEMLHQAFFELLGQRFTSLPGNTRLNLAAEDSGSQYLSGLTMQNVPLSFTWGGQDRIAKAIQISTIKRRSGFLDVVLRYYEDEILEGSASDFGSTAGSKTPFAEIVLLEDVAFFEWRVLNARTMEWEYDWDAQGSLPLQLELTLAIGAHGQEMRHIFWLPPKQNPETSMRQMMQENATQPGGLPGGGGGQPGGGGNKPPIIKPMPVPKP